MPRPLHAQGLRAAVTHALAVSAALAILSIVTSTPLLAHKIAEASLPAAEQALARGDVVSAADIYDQLVRQGESLPTELGQIRVALQSGEFRKAVAHANLTAGENPQSSEAAALLAFVIDRSGRTEQALATLSKLENDHPDDWVTVAAHAEILIDRLAPGQAIKLIDTWLMQHHADAPAELTRLLVRAHLTASDTAQTIAPAATQPAWINSWIAPAFQSLPLTSKDIYSAGNGVVMDHGTTVVTYAKLLQGSSGHAWVRNGLGKTRFAEVEKYQGANGEWVRLRLREPFPAQWSIEPSQIAASEGVRFCFLFSFGVPRSVDAAYPGITSGLVLRANAGVAGLMQITSAVGEGHNGAPVFDARGHLLGLALNNGEHQIANQDVRKLLGTNTLVLRMDNALADKVVNNVSSKNSVPQPATPSVEELYERLAPAVVQVVALK